MFLLRTTKELFRGGPRGHYRMILVCLRGLNVKSGIKQVLIEMGDWLHG